MKKIKIFSVVLALGLGLTATYAFKAHKTVTSLVSSTSTAITFHASPAYYIVTNPLEITSTPECVQDVQTYCSLTYTSGTGVTNPQPNVYYIPASDVSAENQGTYNE